MSENAGIRFVLDGDVVEVDNVDPTRTVLQFLREDLGRKGTKEGCAEGDCGACTVVVAEAHEEGSTLRAINSCIQFLPTLDGKQLFTVESLAAGDQLHPAQQAMIQQHGSQCGFCTPGFVMSLFALRESNPSPTRQQIDDALAGNLCRCTGYRPIIDAASDMYKIPGRATKIDTAALQAIRRKTMLRCGDEGGQFVAPRTLDELADEVKAAPQATLLAGGTDVGLWVTKQHRELDCIIYTGNVPELQAIEATPTQLVIGAAVSLTDAIPAIVDNYPKLDELFRRFASPPIRNAGTLGGNVANGSPIGDSMVALMVLDSTLTLRCGDTERTLPLTDFYHDYMVNDLQPGEFLQSINIPVAANDAIVQSHKWSKRFDQDISAVCTAYRLVLDGDTVTSFRMACGGLAGTVKRAAKTEAAVSGNAWNETTLERACKVLADDFTPLTDMRASADIRLLACQNLLRRFYAETQGDGLETVYTYGRQR